MIRQAAILCGGRGTRLGAITADAPKPLLPVGDGPFLDVLVFELSRHGIGKILLLASFHALKIIDYAASPPLKPDLGWRSSYQSNRDRRAPAARCGPRVTSSRIASFCSMAIPGLISSELSDW